MAKYGLSNFIQRAPYRNGDGGFYDARRQKVTEGIKSRGVVYHRLVVCRGLLLFDGARVSARFSRVLAAYCTGLKEFAPLYVFRSLAPRCSMKKEF